MERTYSSEAIVLKNREIGEADKLVTLFTRRFGKVVALARGVRKITSRRSGSLEPATQGIFFFAHGKTWDILTQVQLINSFAAARRHLARVTQVYQLLEVVDLLTREHQPHPEIYDLIVATLVQLNQPGQRRRLLVNNIRQLVNNLGFGSPPDASETALKHHIEAIADRALRTKAILS
jgi:DNA repair protein RecO (recombination protein O)